LIHSVRLMAATSQGGVAVLTIAVDGTPPSDPEVARNFAH